MCMHIACANNVPPAAEKILAQLVSDYTAVISSSACKPNTDIKDTVPAMGTIGAVSTQAGKAAGEGVKGAKKVKQIALKRPARR